MAVDRDDPGEQGLRCPSRDHRTAAICRGGGAGIDDRQGCRRANRRCNAAATDGSGTVVAGGTAQTLFAGVVPINGYLIANNSLATIYVSDVGPATSGGASIPIAAGAVFVTPSGYKPAGPVSIFSASTGETFAARRW